MITRRYVFRTSRMSHNLIDIFVHVSYYGTKHPVSARYTDYVGVDIATAQRFIDKLMSRYVEVDSIDLENKSMEMYYMSKD